MHIHAGWTNLGTARLIETSGLSAKYVGTPSCSMSHLRSCALKHPQCHPMQEIVDPNLAGFVKVHHSSQLDGTKQEMEENTILRFQHARDLWRVRPSD